MNTCSFCAVEYHRSISDPRSILGRGGYAPLQKPHRSERSYVRTGALSETVYVPAQELSSIVQTRGGTLGISGWGCAAGTLEPLTYTRASSAKFCYPIQE